jgi:glucose-6-phosphate dehydrogenase assembly protein OpcA
MAATVVERAWRDSTPEHVEDDLSALWREIAGAGPAVARAVMANLVVFRFQERRRRPVDHALDSTDAAIEAVIGLHPSRTIVMEHQRGDHGAQAPSHAGVGISLFGAPPARYGVERIVVRSACADVSLPSIVRRFVRGDRPTSVWWTEDLSREAPLDALVEVARQLVYDSRGWHDVRSGFSIVAPLAQARRVDLADMNWRRLDPVRRALVHALAGNRIEAATRLSITHGPGETALAWLLAGWLAARLRLTAEAWPSIEKSRSADEILTLTLASGSTSVTAAMNAHRVLVSQEGVAPVVVAVPEEQAAESMAAELRMLSRDAALAEAVMAVAQRVES